MNKKMQARMEMMRKLSKDKHSELNSGIGEALKGKKVSKVEVIAKDKEGLSEGLSKAQQILKAKLGEALSPESDAVDESESSEAALDSEDEHEEAEEHVCPACGYGKKDSKIVQE